MKKIDLMNNLLSVVDPEYPYTFSMDEFMNNSTFFNSVVELAEKNGFYYQFISNLLTSGFSLNKEGKARWDEENHKLIEFKKTLGLLDKVADEIDVEYVIIKACNSIPHVPRDIDIFVRKNDRMKIITALEKKGLTCVQLGIAETSLKGDYMKVDIYTEICYMGVDFIEGEFLLHSRIRDEIFGVKYFGLNNEANLLLLLVHGLFGHRNLTLLDFLHIMDFRNETNIDECTTYASKRGWGLVFKRLLGEVDGLIEKIYQSGDYVHFPYLFGNDFVWECILDIDNFELTAQKRFFISITLAQDWIIYKLKDTPIYNTVKSSETIRNFVNILTAFIKSGRGDKKSIN